MVRVILAAQVRRWARSSSSVLLLLSFTSCVLTLTQSPCPPYSSLTSTCTWVAQGQRACDEPYLARIYGVSFVSRPFFFWPKYVLLWSWLFFSRAVFFLIFFRFLQPEMSLPKTKFVNFYGNMFFSRRWREWLLMPPTQLETRSKFKGGRIGTKLDLPKCARLWKLLQVDAVELNTGGKPLRMRIDKPLGQFKMARCQIGTINMWGSVTHPAILKVSKVCPNSWIICGP